MTPWLFRGTYSVVRQRGRVMETGAGRGANYSRFSYRNTSDGLALSYAMGPWYYGTYFSIAFPYRHTSEART